jgi:hypothetical protein
MISFGPRLNKPGLFCLGTSNKNACKLGAVLAYKADMSPLNGGYKGV